jgi:prepilin-type N-terminal cleavage/methylation domain-containing protein
MKRGFTLLEIVIVVAIVGLLGAMILPIFIRRAEEQSASACLSNLKQIGLAFRQYVQEHSKFPPPARHAATDGWAIHIQPYLKDITVYQCPGEMRSASTDPGKNGFTDFWFNSNLFGVPDAGIEFLYYTPLCGDGSDGIHQTDAAYSISEIPKTWTVDTNSPIRRHSGSGHHLFADAHVKKLGLGQYMREARFSPR